MGNPIPDYNKIPGMSNLNQMRGTSANVDNPEDVFNNSMQPIHSVPGRKENQVSDLTHDLTVEKTTFAPPSLISNAGSFSLNTPMGGTQVISYDPKTGKAIINGAITLTQSLTVQSLFTIGTGGSIQGIAKEWYMELIDASYFTGNANYEAVGPGPSGTQCVKNIIADTDFPTNVYDLYFEATLSADGTQAIDCRLWNNTGGVSIAWAVVNSGTATQGVAYRGTHSFALTAGTNEYIVQMRKTPTAGTGLFPRVYSARLVARLKGQ